MTITTTKDIKPAPFDLTILVPGIRTHLWEKVVDSIAGACQKFDYEVLFVGPFSPPTSLQQNYQNIRYIKSYEKIPVVTQKATILARGELVFHATDDSEFFPQSIDRCIQQWYDIEYKTANTKHVINCRYREGINRSGNPLPINFWRAGFHNNLNLPGIDPNLMICALPLMSRRYFIELGGFNCIFEYSNHCLHDFMFRLQRDGGKIINSEIEVANVDHMPGKTGDHGPIHDAQTLNDEPIFRDMYSDRNELGPIVIQYDNFREYEGVWGRRFPSLYESYAEMMNELQYAN